MVEQIDIYIDDDGIKFDAKDFKGKTCVAEYNKFKALMKDAGIDIEDEEREFKKEYHVSAGDRHHHNG